MRTLSWGLVGSLALLTLGCAGGSNAPTAPQNQNPPPAPAPAAPVAASAHLGNPYQHGAIHESALAIYTLDIDPGNLTATSRLKEVRQGQANDDLYLLSIDNFLTADSFRIFSVARIGANLELGYLIEHPFPAPNNPTGAPNGFSNRSDLGIAGMVLFLADVSSATGNTYFSDRVANTELISNADAYYSPEDLLSVSATANTFPYRQIVDEALDPRSGVSNGGNVKGNFGTDGWTRAKYGPNNDGWTGYGVLHQGQTATNVVAFDITALGSGFSLDIAVIAKYNDPRGGATAAQKRSNRLPGATADHTQFAYRMPHGALDVASISFVGDNGPGFLDTGISGTELEIHVIDWDANGTPSGQAPGALELDPVVTNVEAAEAGSPVVEVCIPDVLGDVTATAAVAEDGASGEGIPGDPLIYRDTVTKSIDTAAGTFTGMIRAADPEDGAPLYIPLDQGNPPLPLGSTTTKPRPVTYQPFSVTVNIANTAPTATVAYTGSNPLLSGTQPPYSITSIADAENDTLNILVDWDDGNGFVPAAGPLNFPYSNQNITGPQRNNATLSTTGINVVVRVSDGTANTDYPVPYNLGPNRAPLVTGTRALASSAVTTPAIFTMNAGTGTATDPENDTISYTIVNNRNADVMTFSAFPNAANSTAITNPPDATVAFTVYANDALHPTTGGTAYPVVNGTITPAIPPVGWVYAPATQATGADVGYGIDVDAAGNSYISGTYTTGWNFGGVPRTITTSPGMFLAKVDPNGNYLWDVVFDSSGFDTWIGMACDDAGNAYVAGTWRANIDLGGGIRTNNGSFSVNNYDTFVVKYSPTGTWLWDAQSSGDGSCGYASQNTEIAALGVDRVTGHAAVTSSFNRSELFGTHPVVNALGPTATSFDPVIAKLDAAGNWQWANAFLAGVSTTAERGIAVTFTPSGDVVTSGLFMTGMDFGSGVPVTATAAGDGYIVRLNGTTGAWMWHYTFSSTNNTSEYACALKADASRVYAVGRMVSGTDFGGGVRATLSTTLFDGFALALNQATGAYVWDAVFSGNTSTDLARGVVVSGSDLFVVGDFFTTIDFGGGIRNSAGSNDAYIVKLNNATGAHIYDQRWGSSGADMARSVGVFAGHPRIGGSYSTTVDFDPGPGIESRTVAGSTDAYVLKLEGSNGTFFP